nr:EF-hand domain-containing protein [Rhizobium hidalgonense]
MSAQRSARAGGPRPPPEGDDELASLLSDLDTDGDGLVSKAEFVAGRPSDVSEDQAGTLFDSFDSESAGSLSADALTEAMSSPSSQRPDGPPPAMAGKPEDVDLGRCLLREIKTPTGRSIQGSW